MDMDADFGLDQPSRENAAMRFLIIDDSVTMRRIIANILNRLGYPEVVHAANGREALDRLSSEQVDLVITDWYMPEMNGLDFVKALRTSPATSHIPIVIVTANAASDDIQHALELGVNSYILKPFTVDTMRDKIAALLATRPPQAATAARAAGTDAAEAAPVADAAPAPAAAALDTPVGVVTDTVAESADTSVDEADEVATVEAASAPLEDAVSA